MKIACYIGFALWFFTSLPVGLSAEVATNEVLAAKVDSFFEEFDRLDSPGCAVGIVQHGKLIYRKGFGSANLDHQVPNSPRTVFNTGSVAKTFTSACLAILLDRGKISPDDDIRKYVPELHAFEPPIRIRHMVRCRDGIWAQWHVQQLAGWSAEPLESPYRDSDLLTLLCGQKTLPFEPGTEFQYGTSGYFLLGVVIERVTGLSLAKFAKEHLFDPLEMSNTFYLHEPESVVRHRAVGYSSNGKGDTSDWRQWMQNSSAPGGRCFYSCVEDLYRWDQNFYNNRLPAGKHMREFIDHGTLLDNRNVLDSDPTGTYRGSKRIQFTGAMPGFRAAITRFPQHQFSAICLSNSSKISASNITSRIADTYLEGELGPVPPKDMPVAATMADKVASVGDQELRDKVGAYPIESAATVESGESSWKTWSC